MNNRHFLPVILLVITFLVRLFTVLLIGKIPCMDNEYLVEAGKLLDDANRHPIGLAPSYGILLYALHAITGSLFISSSFCYVIGSFLVSLFAFLIAKAIFNERTGIIVLSLMIFIPNLTVAVAGYSHTPIVGLAFLMAAIYILVLYNKSAISLTTGLALFGLMSTLGIYFRPENLIVVLLLVLIFLFNKANTLNKRLLFSIGSILITVVAINLHAGFIKNNSSSLHVGAFSDSKYSYRAFIHTLSLREIGIIDDTLALNLSVPAFGTPESNEWKISAAIGKNPRVVVSNILYNLKELLHAFGHPLYFPFYLYFFIGAAVFAKETSSAWSQKLSLLILFASSLLHCIFFHVEIRYLSASLMVLLFMTSWGLAQINNSKQLKWTLASITLFTLTIFLFYLNNNIKLKSLCG